MQKKFKAKDGISCYMHVILFNIVTSEYIEITFCSMAIVVWIVPDFGGWFCPIFRRRKR